MPNFSLLHQSPEQLGRDIAGTCAKVVMERVNAAMTDEQKQERAARMMASIRVIDGEVILHPAMETIELPPEG